MLQRIQTVYLALAAIVLGLQGALSMAIFFGEGERSYKMTAFAVQPKPEISFAIPAWTVGILSVLILLGIVYAILQFKNRAIQMRVVRIINIILLIDVVLGFYMVNDYSSSLKNFGFAHSLEYGYGLIVPLVAVVLTMLANKGIKKDEDLIRSADRLR